MEECNKLSWTTTVMRITWLSLLMLGPIALAGCGMPSNTPPPSAPTTYYAPATPIAHGAPPLPPGSAAHDQTAVTVLLLGTDRRSSESTVNNTDTIILFHLEPETQRAAMLSVPRDLFVNIPGLGKGRVNTAYALGKQHGAGGLVMAKETLSGVLDIPIDYAVLIDFRAFVTIVDAIGGIDIDVPYAISDPTYPDGGIGYDPFYISAGEQHLDGATALKYARTRATSHGDFDRTKRQRQVIMAIRKRVLALDMLPGLISKSPQLWADLQGSFESDLTLSEMIELSIAASQVPGDQIEMGAIDEDCTRPWVTPGGAQVLLPIEDKIDALVDDLLLAPAPASASASNP